MNRLYKNLGAPEVLVYLLQNELNCPFENLMIICKPIAHHLIKYVYIENYDTDDLLQEGRIILAEAVEAYRIESDLSFLNYYQMMLKNHFNKLIRKQQAQKRLANKNTYSLEELRETSGLHIEGLAGVDTLPEDVTIVREAYHQYIDVLSEREAAVYTHYINNHSITEIARLLNCKESQVQSALYRCKRKLDDYLA